MIKNTQKGSVHTVIIILLVVVLIGALGFIFRQNFLQEPPATKTAQTNRPAIDEPRSTEKKSNDYIMFDDWKVKAKIPMSLSNTKVVYEKQGDTTYMFTTDRVQKLGDNCSAIVTLSRMTKESVIVNGRVVTPDGELAKKQPTTGYYFVISGSPAMCDGNSEQVEADRTSLKQMLNSLEAI